MATFLMMCFSYKGDATNTPSLGMVNISMLNKGKLHLRHKKSVLWEL